MKENSRATLLKIAVPVVAGRLHGHFAESSHFALVEVDRQSRVIGGTQMLAPPPHEPGSIPRWLREQDVQVVIASGVGQRALDNLIHHGIEVWTGQPGTPVENLVAGYFDGLLSRKLNGCSRQQDASAEVRECRLAAYLKEK